MAEERKFEQGIIRRLDVIIGLLLQGEGETKISMVDRISRLSELGLSPSEIARILGKPLNYVTGAMSYRKRKGGRVDGKQ